MSLQDKIIYQYRQLYPNDTLRDIAGRTNIQLTRVFRLLNGKLMKLEEYEAFSNVVTTHSKKSINTEVYSKIMNEINDLFSANEINEINEYLKRKIFLKKLNPSIIDYSKYINIQ